MMWPNFAPDQPTLRKSTRSAFLKFQKRANAKRSISFKFGVRGCCCDHSVKGFSHLGLFFISVKPLTTEHTKHKTTTKICKVTVPATYTWNFMHAVNV